MNNFTGRKINVFFFLIFISSSIFFNCQTASSSATPVEEVEEIEKRAEMFLSPFSIHPTYLIKESEEWEERLTKTQEEKIEPIYQVPFKGTYSISINRRVIEEPKVSNETKLLEALKDQGVDSQPFA